MKRINHNGKCPYPTYFVHVDSLPSIQKLDFPTRFFTVLVCADFESIETEQISDLADFLMEHGNKYFCAWGRDSERAHDIYDECFVMKEIKGEKLDHVMTTWHTESNPEEALWFTLFLAMVEEKHWDECSTIIITVENEAWKSQVEDALSDVHSFSERLVEDEPNQAVDTTRAKLPSCGSSKGESDSTLSPRST